MAELTTAQVWEQINSQMFAVIGMVSAQGQGRTAGVVYTTHGGRLYFSTYDSEWKARHIAANAAVSVTIPIAKRIPFVPWVKIPPATITFPAIARILPLAELAAEAREPLVHGLEFGDGSRGELIAVEITPQGDYVTYGVGVSLREMRDTEAARGRAPVAGNTV
jgi:hypothetical protein